jgi:hypothetical protein
MLFDENENRIDVAPDDVVTDPRMEDHNVRNGISCFGCHDEIIQTSDAVRDYVAQSTDFDVQTKEAVQKLYASKSAMNALQEQDTEVLRNAYVAAGVDVASPIEPVSESFTRFRLNVDLQRAAAELGVTPTALSSQLGALDPALGLLATGSVKRDVWTTLFAETACLLNVGLTDDPACSASEDTDSDTESGLDADTAYADCANNPSDICGVDSLCLHPAYSSVSVCAPQPCEYDADCPEAPASGDAHVRCDYVPEGESKSCFLDCSAGQTCPDGMVCAEETVCMFEQV